MNCRKNEITTNSSKKSSSRERRILDRTTNIEDCGTNDNRRIHNDCRSNGENNEAGCCSVDSRCELCERLCVDENSTMKNNNDYDTRYRGDDYRGKRTKVAEIVEFSRRDLYNNRSLRCASSVVRWGSKFRGFSRQSLMLVGVIILTIITTVSSEMTAFRSAPPYNSSKANNAGVCQSIDIRNTVDAFKRLENCTVVEGFVQILLIDHANDSAFANLTFPKLVEITDYLVLYRVNGLKSIGHLFPNLAVIRGHQLFVNYAIVAFEMMHLQEVGLHSLTDILRGSVRFEKNPALCYVDTIDWDLIAKTGKGENVISGNKPRNGCPVCDRKCSTRPTKPDETLCWNREHCQKICPANCSSCNPATPHECCNDACLGGCPGGNKTTHCIVCKQFKFLDACVQRCPDDMYIHMNHRCVTKYECGNMTRPREMDNLKEKPYKAFKNTSQCILECPPGFMENDKPGDEPCKKCFGRCLKECPGASVESIASAQKLRGCTHITGSVEIQIRGGKNIVKELEESLSMIEEIDGYLKIVRSFPLISLNFLKNLKVIRGNSLDSGKYTLAVLDNQNLQELWSWNSLKKDPIQILYHNNNETVGKVFFHFNPKLCLHEIETLRIKSGLPEFTDLEVAPNSNGDKVACNVTELKVVVTKKNSEAALVEWEEFQHHDPRSLLGYVVYSIEAPTRNVTMYDGRDACGGDGWRVDDVSATEVSDKDRHVVTHIFTLLKPYTQYAFYVKTYTIATERSGAQSKVTYFTTLPDAPSQPRSLTIWSNSSSELVISWLPPLRKNGNLTQYKITGSVDFDDPAFADQRNYCEEPMLDERKPVSVMAEEERKRAEAEKQSEKDLNEANTNKCSCNKQQSEDLEQEVSSSIAFEDALHNKVYVKRIGQRRRRDIGGILSAVPRKRDTSYAEDRGIDTDVKQNNKIIKFQRTVPATNLTFVMKGLLHFGEYFIEIVACREAQVNDTHNNCSTKAVKAYRTLPVEDADNIPPNSFKVELTGNNSNTNVKLTWAEPPNPNGLIVTYQIEYKRVDIKNVQLTPICITRSYFVEHGNMYTLKSLSPGNYSVKVRATSLAGSGADSEIKYFHIPEDNTSGRFWILFWSISSITVVTLSLGAFYVCKRKFMRNVPSMRLIATVNPEYVSTVYIPDEWEVPRKKIQLMRELGNGSFGMVYEGIAKDVVKSKPEVRCAVKTVNENATDRERIEFLNEASVMKAFNTHHVVRLLGVVSQGQPTLVVMELMVNGDLKTYLRSHRPDQCENFMKQPPTLKRILRMAIEIADGMAYLSAKKFVHRDLAARNCMVAEDLTVKIGDFGMTRDIYETDYYRKGTKGLLPVRWMAPESLKDGVFTSFSDVWSYGVVLWEMVTLASQPYQGLSNDQVLRYVIDGGVMERPENCPDSMYTLMRLTWNHKSNRRPTFIDIATMLLHEVDAEGFDRVSFYHCPEGIEARNQNSSHSPHIDKDLELAALHDLREDEGEGDEDSPLRQDFGDFASIEPECLKNNSHARYAPGSYGENSKVVTNFHDLNSSKVPLKAGFDDFDGVSAGSLNSSKDTLDFPFAEDSLKSVKNSPSIKKKSSSRGSLSLKSMGHPRSPPNNTQIGILTPTLQESPARSTKSQKNSPDYENRTPEIVSIMEGKEAISLRINFPSIDAVDIDTVDDGKDKRAQAEYTDKPETLNNGFISGTTT